MQNPWIQQILTNNYSQFINKLYLILQTTLKQKQQVEQKFQQNHHYINILTSRVLELQSIIQEKDNKIKSLQNRIYQNEKQLQLNSEKYQMNRKQYTIHNKYSIQNKQLRIRQKININNYFKQVLQIKNKEQQNKQTQTNLFYHIHQNLQKYKNNEQVSFCMDFPQYKNELIHTNDSINSFSTVDNQLTSIVNKKTTEKLADLTNLPSISNRIKQRKQRIYNKHPNPNYILK